MKQYRQEKLNLWLIGTGVPGFILFAWPYFHDHENAGGIVGMLLCGLMILCGVFPQWVKTTIFPWIRKHRKPVTVITSLILGVILLETGLMAYGGYQREVGDSKVVVILGSDLHEDGSPTDLVVNRLEKGLAYANAHPDSRIIVCGGLVSASGVKEAEGMKTWLISRGFDEERIYTDTESRSTKENLENAMKYLDDPEGLIIISTNNFHQFRAQTLARQLGLNTQVLSASTPWYVWPTYYLRELMAIPAQFVLHYCP